MQLPPFTLLRPRDLRVGQLVQGLASDTHWWDAKVASLHGEGDDACAELRFVGFSTKHNEAFKEHDKAIRMRLPKADVQLERMPARWREKLHLRNPDGSWPIERLNRKRKRGGRTEYLVRWKVSLPPALRLPAPAPAPACGRERHSRPTLGSRLHVCTRRRHARADRHRAPPRPIAHPRPPRSSRSSRCPRSTSTRRTIRGSPPTFQRTSSRSSNGPSSSLPSARPSRGRRHLCRSRARSRMPRATR